MTLSPVRGVRIQICGPLAIEADGQRIDACLPGRQGRLLFIYLVVNRHRQVSRDELAESLWRESDPATVDTRLNPLLSKLRRVFGTEAVIGRSTLRLCLPDASVDLESAVEATHRAESASHGKTGAGPGDRRWSRCSSPNANSYRARTPRGSTRSATS